MIPDGVIFDVDGVLVDVSGSYLAAVARAVQWVFTREHGLRDDGPLVDDGVIAAFKRAGGYNNDWDLAHALALWYGEALRSEHHSTSALRSAAGDPGGAARVPIAERARRVARPSYDEVKALMLELYWGSAEAARRFGVRPRLDDRDPLLAAERILLRPETLEALRVLGVRAFGVVTGRLRVEWEAVRERLPLPPDTPVVTDEDGRKPDPWLLAALVRRMAARRPCYVGDVMDDWRLVEAYNASVAGRERPALGVMLGATDADEAAFRRAGATLFARDVNALPAVLTKFT